jgi:MFS family permease
LGIKCFGSIMGLVSLGGTAGATLGPIAAGWIHDMTSTYTNAYELFLVINIIGLVASLACLPYKTELARMAGVVMPQPVAQVPKSG